MLSKISAFVSRWQAVAEVPNCGGALAGVDVEQICGSGSDDLAGAQVAKSPSARRLRQASEHLEGQSGTN